MRVIGNGYPFVVMFDFKRAETEHICNELLKVTSFSAKSGMRNAGWSIK